MIRVDRSTVREPRGLKRLRDAGLKHAREFFLETPPEERRQTRYFNAHWQAAYWVPVPALYRLFHGKCAFCESKVDPEAPGVLDHYRPKWATRGLEGAYAPDHYWWLAFAWDNLYLACPTCNKQRGPRFPVRGARINGPGEAVANEEPLLLDPCADNPEEHLRFDQSGRVSPLSARGETTIGLVALNRSDLVERRRAVALEVERLCSALTKRTRPRPSTIVQLNAHLDARSEFSACATQLLRSYLTKAKREDSLGELRGLKLPAAAAGQPKRVVHSSTAEHTPRFIDEVTLENFRGIAKLTLRAPNSDQSKMDWLMLIGENAAGKSSILQGIALNLMSDTDRKRLALPPLKFIKRGTSRARVQVRFRNDDNPRVLTITPAGFKSSDLKAGAPLMAYGATRLPRRAGMSKRSLPHENLFNPFTPLLDPVKWLLKLTRGTRKERTDFDYAARALAALLPGKPEKWRFSAVKGDIVVATEGSLLQLSDGYQSVIALASDIMATVHRTFHGGMEAAEGVVLLDELGAHLHPQWKMRVTKVLREAFPRLQFIATTHDPLCLRGLRNGEIVTIEKTARGRVFARTDLPPIEGMQVDQILQSEYFGLRSALDPDIEAHFERMYHLKAKPTEALTARQRTELGALEKQLAPHDVLGSTRAERLMLSEITRFLARERGEPDKRVRDRAWGHAQKRIEDRLHERLGVEV